MTISATANIKTSQGYAKELQELLGENVPIHIEEIGGRVSSIVIEEKWLQTVDGQDVEKELSKDQVSKANAWIKENVEVA